MSTTCRYCFEYCDQYWVLADFVVGRGAAARVGFEAVVKKAADCDALMLLAHF